MMMASDFTNGENSTLQVIISASAHIVKSSRLLGSTLQHATNQFEGGHQSTMWCRNNPVSATA